jgi:pyruvate dehydrogenase E2 component (dihydrolipoamide acetyltransferase)
MSKEYKLEDPGEGITEAEVVEVMVNDGDEVKDGDPLLTVETDKAANEIPANFNGTVESVKVKEGETIKVGQVLVTYNDGSGDDSEEESDKESQESEASDEEQKKTAKEKDKKKDKKKSKGQKEEKEKTEEKADDEPEDEASEEQKEAESSSDRPVPAAPATR